MEEYVPVPVPRALVPRVMRLVSDYLGEFDESPSQLSSETWAYVGARNDIGTANDWWGWLRPTERSLIELLARSPGYSLEATAAAEQLGMSSGQLAGVLGPLNRRSRRDRYPTAVRSRQETAHDGSGRRIKILSLEDGVAPLVARQGKPPEATPHSPAKIKPRVRPRRRSEAASVLEDDSPE